MSAYCIPESDGTLAYEAKPRPSLLERHFRGKLDRMYAKSAERQRRAPVKLAKAAEKRARKAQRRGKSS